MNDKTMPKLPQTPFRLMQHDETGRTTITDGPIDPILWQRWNKVSSLYTAAQMHTYAQAYAAAQTTPRSEGSGRIGDEIAGPHADDLPDTATRRSEGVVTEAMVRRALHFAPLDLGSGPSKWRWMAAHITAALREDVVMQFADRAFKELELAKKMFGEYSYHDKGASEVMDVDVLASELSKMTMHEAREQLLKLHEMEDTFNLITDLLMSLQEWQHFDGLIENDVLATYY